MSRLLASLAFLAPMLGRGRRGRSRQAALEARIGELEEQARWYQGALRIAGAGVWQLSLRTGEWNWIEDVFQACGSTLRYRVAKGDEFYARVHPEDRVRLMEVEAECLAGRRTSLHDDYRYRLESGEERWLRDIGHVVSSEPGGEPELMLGITIDITQERQRAIADEQRSSYDELTGLANRRKLMDVLQARCETASARPFSVAFMDLNGFKLLNDRHGHAAGDRCLEALGRALRASCGPDEFAARIGGDEFVLVIPAGDHASADTFERLRDLVEDVLARVKGIAPENRLGAAVGIAHCPPLPRDPQALLEAADRAMYVAKASGRTIAFSTDGEISAPRRLSA